jgi:signal transduction histidine kinase
MKPDVTELKRQHERLSLLYRFGQVIRSTLDPQQAMQLIVNEAVKLVGASSGSAVLVNPTTGLLEIQAAMGLPHEAGEVRLRVGQGITGWVARTGKPARVGDVRTDPRYILLRPEVRSELAVPLELEGAVRGVLNVDSDKPDAFSNEHQELLEALAVEASRVIHDTWLYEQLRLRARLFESLAGVSRAINSTLSLDEALEAVTREARRLMNAKLCSLMLVDDSGEWLDLRASFGASPAYVNKPRLSVEESLLGVVLRRKKPLQVENVQTSARYQHVEIAKQEGLVALLSVPLLFSGRAIGALSVYTGQPYVFSNDEVRILSALAELSAIAIEKARLYERVVDVEEQLRQNAKLSALGLLAAEVAHEIRNPLTVMKMLYESLDLRFPEGDSRGKDARIIEEKMIQLNRIVERTLDLARTAEASVGPVKLDALIDELCLLVRHKLKHQNVALIRNLQPHLPPVRGDAAQLEQAFLNLILNAVEAMPRGGTLTISTRAAPGARGEQHPRGVLVQFKDTGQGMTEEQRRNAFSSVFKSTKVGGTGLGLAIVARVVEAHNGQIRLRSRPGHGTTVAVLLPGAVPP